ncbi:LysR substrate-binding domain-containing protein [Methylorubrum extorquens]
MANGSCTSATSIPISSERSSPWPRPAASPLLATLVGRTQSAVSQKVLRLEKAIGRRVFARTSRSLRLTRDGERLLVVARRMLELNDTYLRSLRDGPGAGTLRLGVAENLVATQVPALVSRFCRLYPGIHLDLMTGLSFDLVTAYKDGQLDGVIARGRRDPGTQPSGRIIWREPLVWMAAADHVPNPGGPARLVMLRAPCNFRETMIEALESIRGEWITVCTSSSLTGLQAAVAGGMGATALGRSFAREDLKILNTDDMWPPLPTTEIVAIGEEGPTADLVRPLVSYLEDRMAEAGAFSRAA